MSQCGHRFPNCTVTVYSHLLLSGAVRLGRASLMEARRVNDQLTAGFDYGVARK